MSTTDEEYWKRDARKFESLWRRAKIEKTTLEKRVDELCEENEKLRNLCLRMRTYMAGVVEHNSYQIMTTGYTMLGGRIKECDEAMKALGIEVPE